MTIKVVHIHNGKKGGIFGYIKQLLISNRHQLKNILMLSRSMDTVQEIEVQPEYQIFTYSKFWNFYHTAALFQRTLAKFDVVIAHDWLELACASLRPNPLQKLIFVLHGDYDYYYDLAVKNESVIDGFLAVSHGIANKLKDRLPHRREDIYCCRAVVPENEFVPKKENKRVVFVGRLTTEKGFDKIPAIAETLRQLGFELEWYFIGEGEARQQAINQWNPQISCHFLGSLSAEKVRETLASMDFFILPSLAEGLPISAVEAMKAGVIPIIHNCSDGVRELLGNGENGILVNANTTEQFANELAALLHNESRIEELRSKGKLKVQRDFDAKANLDAFESALLRVHHQDHRQKQGKKLYGSRLDQPYIPNQITTFFRAQIHRLGK